MKKLISGNRIWITKSKEKIRKLEKDLGAEYIGHISPILGTTVKVIGTISNFAVVEKNNKKYNVHEDLIGTNEMLYVERNKVISTKFNKKAFCINGIPFISSDGSFDIRLKYINIIKEGSCTCKDRSTAISLLEKIKEDCDVLTTNIYK